MPNYAEEIEYGDGTAENPYLISSGDVFEAVCKVLDKDKSHGAGKHFLQTQNIEISSNNSSSSGVVEEGWFNVDFAGVYDGGNFTVTGFSFNGARDEVAENIGLFRTLRNGAVVKNLASVVRVSVALPIMLVSWLERWPKGRLSRLVTVR